MWKGRWLWHFRSRRGTGPEPRPEAGGERRLQRPQAEEHCGAARERPEHEDPFIGGDEADADRPQALQESDQSSQDPDQAELPAEISPSAIAANAAPAPADFSFDGLDFANWGQGHPPDENGDVGPNYYIQTVNVSIGIYDKSNGNRVAAFTFNSS